MLLLPVSARRRAATALAGALGTLASLVPAAVGAEYAERLTPALPQSVSFTDAAVQPAGYVQASPVLRSGGPVVGPLGRPLGPGAYGPLVAPPRLRGTVPPRPFPFYDGPRRISGLPAYRPFGLPMLSEVGAAIGAGVGAVGAGVGAVADNILLGPVGTPLCGAGACPPSYVPPPSCVVPQIDFQPLAACPPPACVAPLCPPPVCAAPEPICAAPPPPSCVAPPACAAPPVCAAPPTCDVELVPQTTTKYARRECVTWKEVECIAYRDCKEEYVEPVCRTECRVVDRGCWKKIWVPNLVTEEYTTTDYVRRCRVRRVPYTYTKQVAERCEKIVPYCATTYVPRPVSACLPEPDCGAPDLMPRYPSYGPADVPPGAPPAGSYYGAEAYDLGSHGTDSYGGAMYGDTGVPGVEEYMSPQSAPAPVPLRPIPNDDFNEGAAPGPESDDRTSMLSTVPSRTAARGWTEQPRQF